MKPRADVVRKGRNHAKPRPRLGHIVIGATKRHRFFVTTSDHGFTDTRPHLLCSCRSFAAHYLQIVNRKS